MFHKVLTGQLTFKSLKPCDLSNCTKRQIKDYFENTYDIYESLFTSLKDDSAIYKCPDRLRLPLIFYYGHTAAVYVNKLVLAGLIQPEERVKFEYEKLFETGVDEMSWDDVENFRMGPKFNWPKVDDVVEFRRGVRNLIIDVINRCKLQLPVTVDSQLWGLFMGMEHERIHLETSSVLIRQLPIDLVRKPPSWNYGPLESSSGGSLLENPMVKLPGGDVTFGKPWDFPSYGWDNEYGQATHTVAPFEVAKYPTTNAQFLTFIKAGGYKKREYWTDEGWKWVKFRQARHPVFWVCSQRCKSGCGGDLAGYSHCGNFDEGYSDEACDLENLDQDNTSTYRLRLMFDTVDMPWNWPVEVNYLEAKAYCAWLGSDCRLPSEAEQFILRGPMLDPSHGTSCDLIFDDVINSNINMQFGSSTPVDMFEPNSLGLHDVSGNVWQWLEDHFNGLPGFQTSFFYDDFSSPCFDGRHTLISGGSWMSTGDEASRFARFAFRRHFFQHLGFRVVRTLTSDDCQQKIQLPIVVVSTPVFVLGDGIQAIEPPLDPSRFSCLSVESTNTQYRGETDEALSTSLHTEYMGNGYSPAAKLYARCQQLISNHLPAESRLRALHVGCCTGRVTFELASLFKEVIGVDAFGRFIDAAIKLQKGQSISYSVDNKMYVASLDGDKRKGNVIFKQFTWLPNELEFFSFVLCTFLHRMQNIKAWLVRMREILQVHGILIIADTCRHGLIDKSYVSRILESRFHLITEEILDSATQPETKMHVTAWIKQ